LFYKAVNFLWLPLVKYSTNEDQEVRLLRAKNIS